MEMSEQDSMVSAAREIAIRAHDGQVDKIGAPYILHPERVAARLPCPQAQAVAWLHDVLEDTHVTAEDLLAAGIPLRVVQAVQALTHSHDEPLPLYYRRVVADELAREVKLADVADNSDPARLALLNEATRSRLQKKYARAMRYLMPESEKAQQRHPR